MPVSDDRGGAATLMLVARSAVGRAADEDDRGPRERDPRSRSGFRPRAASSPASGSGNRAWTTSSTSSAFGGIAGGVALLLAALGIYGVVGLMVTTRTREIAVRVTLGASRPRVIGMILFDVVKLVAPGVAVGRPHHGRSCSPRRRSRRQHHRAAGLRRRRRDCDPHRGPRQPRPCPPRRVGPADGGDAIDVGAASDRCRKALVGTTGTAGPRNLLTLVIFSKSHRALRAGPLRRSANLSPA